MYNNNCCNDCGGSNHCGSYGSNCSGGFGQDYIWIILVVIIILFGFGGFNGNGNNCCNPNPCC